MSGWVYSSLEPGTVCQELPFPAVGCSEPPVGTVLSLRDPGALGLPGPCPAGTAPLRIRQTVSVVLIIS